MRSYFDFGTDLNLVHQVDVCFGQTNELVVFEDENMVSSPVNTLEIWGFFLHNLRAGQWINLILILGWFKGFTCKTAG